MGPATAGYVLVGGRSSRFGADKALAEWQGRPLAVSVAEKVLAAAGAVALVGPPERYGALGFRVLPDAAPGLGPLGGIVAALADTQAGWNLVLACDMPHVTVAFLEFLLRLAQQDTAEVVMPLDRSGRDEPLCAVYARSCRGPIAAAIERGVRKVTGAFSGLRVRRVAFPEYAALDAGGGLFANLNTQDEMEEARLRHA